MPYQINKFNGDRLVVLQDGTLDSTTSIGLVGKNFAGYGEIQNENMLWMLENFAGEGAPPKAITGQLWFDSLSQRIKVYNGTNWRIVGNTVVSSTQPIDVAAGDGWLNDTNKKFHVYDGNQFVFVGPEGIEGYSGPTRAISENLADTTGSDNPVIKITVNGSVIAVVSATPFTTGVLPGFTDIDAGITLNSSTFVRGNLHGNADSSSKFSTPRNINGVAFDGTANITITANTTNDLIAGQYLTGNNFNGSNQTTWTVSATASDVQDTIVARDSSGNFRAGTITADLVGDVVGTHYGNVQGNLTGNVTGTVNGDVIGNVTGGLTGNVVGSVSGNVTGSLTGNVYSGDGAIAYDEASKTFTGTFNGNANTASRLKDQRRINGVLFDGTGDITIADATKLPVSGGSLTGNLTLPQDPTAQQHAATKNYVDTVGAQVYQDVLNNLPEDYTITYGNTQYSTSGYTNIVGSFNNSRNYFDVYPPAGKSMSDLVAFLPSIAVIHYAGGVDGNDSLRCIWSNLGNRIRVYVQNTEQRSTPAANWLAIWR